MVESHVGGHHLYQREGHLVREKENVSSLQLHLVYQDVNSLHPPPDVVSQFQCQLRCHPEAPETQCLVIYQASQGGLGSSGLLREAPDGYLIPPLIIILPDSIN